MIHSLATLLEKHLGGGSLGHSFHMLSSCFRLPLTKEERGPYRLPEEKVDIEQTHNNPSAV